MNNNKQIFNQNIFQVFGIDKMPAEQQEEMINRVGGIIFQSVLLRVLPTMNDDDLKSYETLLDKKAMPDEVLDLLFEKVPNLLQIIIEESEKMRKEASEALQKS